MTTELLQSPFQNMKPPSWADGWGQDEYGYFADFSVAKSGQSGQFVTQRMRWIPPGTFIMGSTENEPKRFLNEGPAHHVTLTSGFWLADTACTQELWAAVTGSNPSHFIGDQRPVECVSFEDVKQFMSQLNTMLPALNTGLPTEAQWEYACRAGTTTPFSTGHKITTDQANYDGNYPYNDGPKGSYRQETVDVTAVPQNRWGLFQMHGNVWEWCEDWYGAYSGAEVVDPTGFESSGLRVIRGGGWSASAQYVRAAFRGGLYPSDRDGDLGFRCSSSGSSPPNK